MKALLCALCLLGCAESKHQSSATGSASAKPVVAPPAVVTADLSSRSAFELTAVPQGLRLIWASAASSAAWLYEVELGHDGAPRGKARRIELPARVLGNVADLTASYVGEQLAVGWLEQGKAEARAVASLVEGTAPPALIDLGPAASAAESARGNIAIVAEVGSPRALVMWRGLTAPCVEPQSSPCVGFTFRRLRSGGTETTGMPLSVPVPCSSHSVQLVTSAGRFHYGVCTRDGSDPVTTMFSIQQEPPYARAEPLLKGCLPLGSLLVGEAPWLVADCHGKRRAVPVPLADEKVTPEAVDALKISCTAERAELRQGRFVLGLREPRAGLQSILPSSWLPTGARAGWTGKSLVVAYENAGKLETRVYACRAGTLAAL